MATMSVSVFEDEESVLLELSKELFPEGIMNTQQRMLMEDLEVWMGYYVIKPVTKPNFIWGKWGDLH